MFDYIQRPASPAYLENWVRIYGAPELSARRHCAGDVMLAPGQLSPLDGDTGIVFQPTPSAKVSK